MTQEGRESLAKIRSLSYILFIFYFAMFFHTGLTKLFNTSETKILYGFIAIIATQILLCTLHIIKFGMTVQSGKKKSVTMMVAARVRAFFMIQGVFLIVQAVNATVMRSQFIDFGCIVINILNMIMVLKNLTILQRGSFTQDLIEEASCGAKANNLKRQKKEAAKKTNTDQEDKTYRKKNKSNKSRKNYQANLKTKAETVNKQLEKKKLAENKESNNEKKLQELKALKKK